MSRLLVFCALLASAYSASLKSSVIDPEWEGRIVGGSTAAAGQFPHMASLRTSGNTYFCGGFIINNRWAGSAAHCECFLIRKIVFLEFLVIKFI